MDKDQELHHLNLLISQLWKRMRYFVYDFPGFPFALLASQSDPVPPSKIVLIVPFDILENVAHELFPALPETMKIRDNWNNIKSLKSYQGPIEIFGAKTDSVIRIAHARALAASKPSAIFHEIDGGHNEWSKDSKVKIKFP